LRAVYTALEHELADSDFISGTLSVADIALFPHLASAKAMEAEFSDVLAGAAHGAAAQAGGLCTPRATLASNDRGRSFLRLTARECRRPTRSSR
jgi:glutathione S-transferase